MTRCINSSSMALLVIASNVPDSMRLKIKAAKMSGEIIPANLLHIPMMLIRRAALSIGPMIVT